MSKLNVLGGPLTPQEMKQITGGVKTGWSASGTSYAYADGWVTEYCHWDEYTLTVGGKLKNPTGNTHTQDDGTWYNG